MQTDLEQVKEKYAAVREKLSESDRRALDGIFEASVQELEAMPQLESSVLETMKMDLDAATTEVKIISKTQRKDDEQKEHDGDTARADSLLA